MATLKKTRARANAAPLADSEVYTSASTAPGGRYFARFDVVCGDFRLALSRSEAENLAANLARQLGADSEVSGPGRRPWREEPEPADVLAWRAAGHVAGLARLTAPATSGGPNVGALVTAAPYRGGPGEPFAAVVTATRSEASDSGLVAVQALAARGNLGPVLCKRGEVQPLPGDGEHMPGTSPFAALALALGRFLAAHGPGEPADVRPPAVLAAESLAVGFPPSRGTLAADFRQWAVVNAHDGGNAINPTAKAAAFARAAAFAWAARSVVLREVDADTADGRQTIADHTAAASAYLSAMTPAKTEAGVAEEAGRAAVAKLARIQSTTQKAADYIAAALAL